MKTFVSLAALLAAFSLQGCGSENASNKQSPALAASANEQNPAPAASDVAAETAEALTSSVSSAPAWEVRETTDAMTGQKSTTAQFAASVGARALQVTVSCPSELEVVVQNGNLATNRRKLLSTIMSQESFTEVSQARIKIADLNVATVPLVQSEEFNNAYRLGTAATADVAMIDNPMFPSALYKTGWGQKLMLELTFENGEKFIVNGDEVLGGYQAQNCPVPSGTGQDQGGSEVSQ